ncbi:MAG TPA: epoxide hydrolase, partial [Stellaceae bacterium]|nr:epoxide hydrolase [Stellaceae bacterium]
MIENFTVNISEPVLDDLRRRLAATRWAADYANDDWGYGTNGAYLKELCAYWQDGYDWRRHERAMNGFRHFRTEIDGIPIHFIHERGKGPAPMPLVMTHGWPWTFWDLHKVIRPLTDPASFGGDPADAFDVVVPSLPGFGFSTPLRKPGYPYWRTADLWVTLMRERLGYDRFAAQGGDYGAFVTGQLGHKYAAHVIGIHVHLIGPMGMIRGNMP